MELRRSHPLNSVKSQLNAAFVSLLDNEAKDQKKRYRGRVPFPVSPSLTAAFNSSANCIGIGLADVISSLFCSAGSELIS